MKITHAQVIVCSPSRNFVTLEIGTDQGVYGLGDATLNGREKAVVSYLEDHCIPALLGRDPANIEDIWHYFYRGSYWKRGSVAMTALSAIDVALWDIAFLRKEILLAGSYGEFTREVTLNNGDNTHYALGLSLGDPSVLTGPLLRSNKYKDEAGGFHGWGRL